MIIDIVQYPISIPDQYSISIGGFEKYTGRSKLFKINNEIHICKKNSSSPKLIIKDITGVLTKYEISYESEKYLFVANSFWILKYKCIVGPDTYEIFGHYFRRFSIYRNSKQIGYIHKSFFKLGDGDIFKVIVDKQTDYLLISAFVLILDNKFYHGTSIALRLALPGKKLNKLWNPN
jgi:hypothetical protein